MRCAPRWSGRAARSRRRDRVHRRAAPRDARRRPGARPAPAGRWSRGCRRRTRRAPTEPSERQRLGSPSKPRAAAVKAVLVGRARDAEALQHGARHRGVARVVRARSGRRMPTMWRPAPPRRRPPSGGAGRGARLRVQLRVGIVGQGQGDPGFGAERQLVGVVPLDRPVPVEVVRRQGGDGDHGGCVLQVGDLEARRLNDPVVRCRPAGGSQGGSPMLPPARASTPSPRRRWTASAVVVLFPFVPVMQATRVGSASAMNRPSPPQTATPASSSCATSGR